MQFTLKNEDVQRALLAMARLVGGGNRLATLPGLRAARTRTTLAKAWEPVEERRLQLLKDHGKPARGGKAYDFDTPEARKAWADGWKEACEEERTLELEPLTLAEVGAGYYRDPETGQKEPGLDLSPEDLGILVELGLVQVMPETSTNPLGG